MHLLATPHIKLKENENSKEIQHMACPLAPHRPLMPHHLAHQHYANNLYQTTHSEEHGFFLEAEVLAEVTYRGYSRNTSTGYQYLRNYPTGI